MDSYVVYPSFVPLALSSGGYYLPTNYRSLYGNRTDLDQLDIRLQTFIFWPSWVPVTLNTAEMARQGLYYTGDEDSVRCYRCSFSFSGWKEGDDPKVIHRKMSPQCPLLPESINTEIDSDEGEDFVDFGGSETEQLSSSERTKIFSQVRTTNISERPSKSICSERSRKFDSEESDCCSDQSDCDSSDQWSIALCVNDTRTSRTDLRTFSSSKITSDVSRNDVRCQNNKEALHRFTINDKERLKAENEKLRTAMTCRKCLREKSQTLFLPCRHLVTCEQCADEMDDCIFCHQKILGTVRIFMT